jgi:5'-nucleotidase
MGNREIVLVDMDGVIADFDSYVVGQLPPEVPRVERANFYVAHDYPEHEQLVREITAHPQFFSELEPVENALEGWQRLLDLGYDPVICSAPLRSNRSAIEGKIIYLTKHFVPQFGAQVVERAIIDKKKYLYGGLVLIDDRPEVDTGNGQAEWQHIVFDRPYNKHAAAGLLRLMGWNDPNMANILEQAKELKAQKAS